MLAQLLSINLTGTDLVIIIPLIGAQIVAVIVALRNGLKADAIDAKLVTRNGSTVAEQVENIATAQALSTPPEQRTVAQVVHLASEQSVPANTATTIAVDTTSSPPPPGGNP